MTTAYTSLLGLALPVTGELSGTWGDTVNTAITSLLDTAIAGTTSITTDGDITLSTTTGASNQARQAIILWNPASGTTTRYITAPAQSKMYVVINASGGTQSIVIRGAGPTTGVTIAKGESATVAWNGSDFVKVSSSGGAITFTDLTVTGNTILGDAAADTLTVNATSTFASPVNFQGLVKLPSTGRSAAAALTVTAPAFLYGVASTYTDTTSSGTIAAMAPFYSIAQPTLSTSNVTTYTNAATLYIANAPTTGGSATITNPYALYVASGANYLGGALTVAGATSLNGNVTLGDAAADNITVNGTVTSNLIFTDNTYNIGANGATRPANGYFSRVVTAGQGANNDWQFLAVDYGQGTGGGSYDGIYTSSIKAGTYQGFGFDTRYQNAGSWQSSQTTASIVDGYQGQFRVFTNSGLTAGTPYTPSLRFIIGSTGLATFQSDIGTLPSITNNITVANSSGTATYGGVIGQRGIASDQRQGMFVKGTGSLTLLSQYYIDFLAGQTAVPLAADTGLAMRINSNKAVSIGGSTADTYPLEIFASGSSSTSKNILNIYYGAAGAAEPTIQFQTANGGIGKLGFITTGASAGQFQLYTADGTSYVNRYTIASDGTQYWYNVGGSAAGTKMLLNSTGLALGTSSVITTLTVNGTDGITMQRSTNNAFAPVLDYLKSRGTSGSPTGVADGDGLYLLRIAPYHGSGYTYLNAHTIEVDGGYTSGQNPPTRQIFYTNTANGSSTGRLAILSGGQVIAGGTTGNSTLERFGVRGTGFMGISVNSDPAAGALPNQSGFMFTNNRSAGSVDCEIVYGRSDISGTTFFRLTKNDAGTLSTQATMINQGQWQVGTTQTFTDGQSASIYPGVVSANALAATGLGGGSTSQVSRNFSSAINTTYTVRVYPSDTTYGVVDIRVGVYQSSGSGSGNAFFCYGGHTGAYQLNTVFNSYTGNVTIGAVSVNGGGWIQFTVTIANSGQSGQVVVMVNDAGATAGKTASIVVL